MGKEFDWKQQVLKPMLKGLALILTIAVYSWFLAILSLPPISPLTIAYIAPTVNGVIGLLILLFAVGLTAQPILETAEELIKKHL